LENVIDIVFNGRDLHYNATTAYW